MLKLFTRVTTKFGDGEIVRHEINKEKLSRYGIKFDKKAPWKDNIGYFMPEEVTVIGKEIE